MKLSSTVLIVLSFMFLGTASLEAKNLQKNWLEKIVPQEIIQDPNLQNQKEESPSFPKFDSVYSSKSAILVDDSLYNIEDFGGAPEATDETFDHPSAKTYCRRSLANTEESLEERLSRCAWIRGRMIWQSGDGRLSQYDEWPIQKKQRLEELFNGYFNNYRNLNLQCPRYNETSGRGEYITEAQAFDVFAAHMAWFLVTEVRRWVPWSLYDYPDVEVAELLSAENYFSTIPIRSGVSYPTAIQAGRDFMLSAQRITSPSVLCDPREAYMFAFGTRSQSYETDPRQTLIAETPERTLVRLSVFARNHFSHDLRFATQHFRFFQFVDRVTRWSGGLISPLGCHSASNLIYDIAKALKIPLRQAYSFQRSSNVNSAAPDFNYSEAHSGLIFGWAGPAMRTRILSHSDDLYTKFDGFLLPLPSSTTGMGLSPDVDSLFFEKTWLRANELEEYGFRYQPTLPRISAGIFHISESLLNRRNSFGRWMGYWLRGCPQDNATSAEYSCLRDTIRNDIVFQTCPWDTLVDSFCRSERSAVVDYYQRHFVLNTNTMDSGLFTPSTLFSSDDFYQKAQACFQANTRCYSEECKMSACDNLRTQYQNWLNNRGSYSWRN